MRVLILIMALFGGPVQAAEQFDLVCMFGKTEVRYRISLPRQEACQGECHRIWKMGASTTGELRVIDTIANYPDEIPQTVTVNRHTGDLVHWIGGTSRPITETATCKPQEFSGFPVAKF